MQSTMYTYSPFTGPLVVSQIWRPVFSFSDHRFFSDSTSLLMIFNSVRRHSSPSLRLWTPVHRSFLGWSSILRWRTLRTKPTITLGFTDLQDVILRTKRTVERMRSSHKFDEYSNIWLVLVPAGGGEPKKKWILCYGICSTRRSFTDNST